MRQILSITVILTGLITTLAAPLSWGAVMQPEDVLKTRYVTSAHISPDGKWVAYTVSVPRDVESDPGARYSELHVVPTSGAASRAFVTGEVNVGGVGWSPDGRSISFRLKRGEDAKTQVWTIPIDGGEASQRTHSANGVIEYRWHPDGKHIFFTATPAQSKREKALSKKGYGFTYYEEKLKTRGLYIEDVSTDHGQPELLSDEYNVWGIEVDPRGQKVAMSASPRNLIDQRYAFNNIYLYDIASRKAVRFSDNEGKLGTFEFSPDGRRIAFTAALNQADHAVSQVFVQPVDAATATNLTVPEFRGHVHWAGWKNNNTVLYRSSEGVYTTLSTVSVNGGARKVVLDGSKLGYSFLSLSGAADYKYSALVASSPEWPNEVFYWNGRGEPRRLTHLNPWLDEIDLGRCEVVNYKARDGWDVEGLLYYPVNYEAGRKYPLMVAVHGGPESHHSFSWKTSYSRPVEVMTGEGYVVFLPNYRASTGYGLAHTAFHIGDAAGVEFDDVADGIKHLTSTGLADPERVGLSGGSYGGFAAAWFASYYTDLVKAVVMFVGISDLTSKRGTTDIPYEELYVHSGKKLEEMWDESLKRSPIYYAHQSKTATLIIGGAADTRVHPSQSIELYRRMKMNNHPAVRLVQYPGEGHGNAKMPGRRDVLYRTVQWYNWFVRDLKPLDGGMPDVDISDLYPLDLPDRAEKPSDKVVP